MEYCVRFACPPNPRELPGFITSCDKPPVGVFDDTWPPGLPSRVDTGHVPARVLFLNGPE